jgi:signal transduction histidine kinase
MFTRPSLKEYAMARLVTIAVSIFLLFTFLLLTIVGENETSWMAIGLLAVAFSLFVFSIYRATGRMQEELRVIAKYLKNLENTEEIENDTHFFTQEFEEINENLIKVLNSAKKREEVKQRYNAKLKLKNRQRSDMISAIAHEFRNPIASIMGYSQTLHEDPDIPQALQRKFLDKIYNNGNKIEDLLRRLILWNKFESGETTLHKSTFDISALIAEIKRNMEEKYKNREIIVDVPETKINADRTLMEVVLKNLIENALKYSQDEVLVKLENTEIFVTDHGVGIGENDLNNVTKKFYRSGTHSWDNSMGLGLSIVKKILSLHNSELEISSELERGSTFSFPIEIVKTV